MEERIQTIPLNTDKAPRHKKARKAVKSIKEHVRKQTDKEIKIDHELNNMIWDKGIQKPPSKLRVKIVDYDDWVTVQPPEKEAIRRDMFECDECGKTFSTEEGLNMHIETTHTEDEEDTEEQVETEDELEEEEKESEEETEEDHKEILSGTISEAKEKIEDMEDPDYEKLLETEKENKDRKGIKSYLENKIEE